MSADLPSPPRDESIALDDALRALLRETLGLDAAQAASFDEETPLFGALPELDSMAVAELLTAMEDRFSIIIDDDDVDGETFETFGNLAAFVTSKLAR